MRCGVLTVDNGFSLGIPGNFLAIFIVDVREFHCTFIESFIKGFRVNGALPNMKTYTKLARKSGEKQRKRNGAHYC